MITQKQCLDLFEYDNGELYWKVKKGRSVVGKKVGCEDGKGYKVVMVNRKQYRVHRIIYLMHHGILPDCLDHINNNKADNRIENLRPATVAENAMNQKIRSTNKSGVKNVCWHKYSKKWTVYFWVNNNNKVFGYYDSLEKAKSVAMKVRKELHKEFARHE